MSARLQNAPGAMCRSTLNGAVARAFSSGVFGICSAASPWTNHLLSAKQIHAQLMSSAAASRASEFVLLKRMFDWTNEIAVATHADPSITLHSHASEFGCSQTSRVVSQHDRIVFAEIGPIVYRRGQTNTVVHFAELRFEADQTQPTMRFSFSLAFTTQDAWNGAEQTIRTWATRFLTACMGSTPSSDAVSLAIRSKMRSECAGVGSTTDLSRGAVEESGGADPWIWFLAETEELKNASTCSTTPVANAVDEYASTVGCADGQTTTVAHRALPASTPNDRIGRLESAVACPHLGQNGMEGSWKDNRITCRVRPNALTSERLAEQAMDEWARGAAPFGLVDRLMIHYCSQPAPDPSACPPVPTASVGQPGEAQCPRMLTSRVCARWKDVNDALRSDAFNDSVVGRWCRDPAYKWTSRCDCANAHLAGPLAPGDSSAAARASARHTSMDHKLPIACWFGPCQSTAYLRPNAVSAQHCDSCTRCRLAVVASSMTGAARVQFRGHSRVETGGCDSPPSQCGHVLCAPGDVGCVCGTDGTCRRPPTFQSCAVPMQTYGPARWTDAEEGRGGGADGPVAPTVDEILDEEERAARAAEDAKRAKAPRAAQIIHKIHQWDPQQMIAVIILGGIALGAFVGWVVYRVRRRGGNRR